MQVTENINNPTYLGLLFGPQNIKVNKTGQLELPDYNVSTVFLLKRYYKKIQNILLSYAQGVKFLAENGMTKEERDAIDWPMVYKDAKKVGSKGNNMQDVISLGRLPHHRIIERYLECDGPQTATK